MPAPSLTGYALTNYFRKLRLRVTISPLQAYLFFELVAICNEEGWPAEFNATNPVLMAGLGCTEEGLNQARKRLREVGLIDFVSGNRRVPTRYWFTVNGLTHLNHSAPGSDANPPTEGTTELAHPAANPPTEGATELDHSATQTTNPPTLPPTEGLSELGPYKEQTKTKELLRKPSLRAVASSQKEGTQNDTPFEAWWAAYDKKRDRFKCVKKWGALPAAEQAAALAHTPAYVAATPERLFRKDPLTYLTGKCWLDEHLPVSRHSQPLTPAAPIANAAPATPAPDLNEEFLAQQAAAADAKRQAHFAKYASATA